MATNDNNNFGKYNMGDANWAPSSRVLARPGGNSVRVMMFWNILHLISVARACFLTCLWLPYQTIQLGWDDAAENSAPARDTSRPRIIGGKIVYNEDDKQR